MSLFVICHDAMAKYRMCMKGLTFLTVLFLGDSTFLRQQVWWVDHFVTLASFNVNSPLLCRVAAFSSIHFSFYATVVRPMQRSLHMYWYDWYRHTCLQTYSLPHGVTLLRVYEPQGVVMLTRQVTQAGMASLLSKICWLVSPISASDEGLFWTVTGDEAPQE